MTQVSFQIKSLLVLQIQFAIGLLCVWGASSAADAQVGDVGNPDTTVEAFFKVDQGQRTGTLFVVLECGEGWVGYSNTTPAGGAMATKLRVTADDAFSVGGFSPLSDPHKKIDDAIGAEVHYHPGGVTWSAPIQLADNVAAEGLEIQILVQGQVCTDGDGMGRCGLVREKVVARYSGETETSDLETTLEQDGIHVIWSGRVSPSQAKPGDTVSVQLTAQPTEGFNIYAYSHDPIDTLVKPTRIAICRSNDWAVSMATPDQEPKQKMIMDEMQSFYSDPVTWTLSLTVPEDAEPGAYSFEGLIGFQNCTADRCDRPSGAGFQFDVVVGPATEGESEIGFSGGGSYNAAEKLADRKASESRLVTK